MLQKFKAVVLLGVHAENMQSLPEEEAIYVSCVFSLLCPPPFSPYTFLQVFPTHVSDLLLASATW